MKMGDRSLTVRRATEVRSDARPCQLAELWGGTAGQSGSQALPRAPGSWHLQSATAPSLPRHNSPCRSPTAPAGPEAGGGGSCGTQPAGGHVPAWGAARGQAHGRGCALRCGAAWGGLRLLLCIVTPRSQRGWWVPAPGCGVKHVQEPRSCCPSAHAAQQPCPRDTLLCATHAALRCSDDGGAEQRRGVRRHYGGHEGRVRQVRHRHCGACWRARGTARGQAAGRASRACPASP